MTKDDILDQLQTLAEKLSIQVRFEKGDFKGGLYKYRSEEKIVINKELPVDHKINILVNELKDKVDLQNLYIVPALREVLEDGSNLGK